MPVSLAYNCNIVKIHFERLVCLVFIAMSYMAVICNQLIMFKLDTCLTLVCAAL